MLKKYSLVVPSWYPVIQLPVSGIFVLKHVQIIAEFIPVQVLYAFYAPEGQPENFSIVEKTQGNFTETIVYYKPSSSKILNQLLQMYSFWKGFRQIHKKQGLPSVIHNHVVFPAGFFALFISVFYRIPLLITEHWTGYSDDDGRYAKLSPFHHLIIKKALKNAKGVSVISEFLKRVMLEKNLIHETQTVLTGNVLKSSANITREKSTTATTAKAVCIANLDDNQKNISGLIDATSEVVKQFPAFTLTLVGDGPERNHLEQRASQLNLLNKNIFFTGNIPNQQVSEQYQTHDFFILNSNFETFSIATAEAIINGLPVVVTKCGGPEEFVNASNGILVRRRETKELCEAMLKMIQTHHTYNSTAISNEILAKYSNRTILQSMKNLYAFVSSI